MCGQPFSLLLCSGGIEVTFKQVPKAKFTQIRCYFAKIPSHFHHSTHNVRSYKAAAWLVQRVGGSLCMHISLSLICFLPFIFSLLYVCNCLFTTVTKFNYSSG